MWFIWSLLLVSTGVLTAKWETKGFLDPKAYYTDADGCNNNSSLLFDSTSKILFWAKPFTYGVKAEN